MKGRFAARSCLLTLTLFVGSLCSSSQAARRQSPSERSIVSLSRTVASLLRQNNTPSSLSPHVDARWGLQFSPEPYASKDDVKLSRSQVARLVFDKTRRVWGSYDGEGGPIRLDWANYRKRFVWTRDFSRGAQISVNRVPAGRSTIINNLRQFYPNATLVEFYLPSTSKDRMDWASLWMIWKKRGATWRLIGIAHDQWST